MAEFAIFGVLELYKQGKFFQQNQVENSGRNEEICQNYSESKYALQAAAVSELNVQNASPLSDAE